MARPATGNVRVRKTKRGESFEIRFTAYGRAQYLHLGTSADGWTRERAQLELQNVLADVRRGIWTPPAEPAPVEEPRAIPTFHEFASEWFAGHQLEGGRKGSGLSPAGAADLEWRLSSHLLPWFARKRLDQITIEDVDRYRRAKSEERQRRDAAIALAEREGDPKLRREKLAAAKALPGLSASSINKTLDTLSAILETASEYELVGRNVAKGRRRRLPSSTPRRTWLDRAHQIAALLDAGGALDAKARGRRGQRRALLATLVLAGLRIDEALSLRWRDVDLASGVITVRASKSDAGIRKVNVLPALQDELTGYRARCRDVPSAGLVFGTSTGAKEGQTNVRRRILARSVAMANEKLEAAGLEPLPERVTPHSLRRTYASLLFALGETPVYVMAQLGHATPALTLAIYARQMDRRDGEPERLKALVEGAESGRIWTGSAPEADRDEVATER